MSGNEAKHIHEDIEKDDLFYQKPYNQEYDKETAAALIIFAIFASLNISLIVIILLSLIFK